MDEPVQTTTIYVRLLDEGTDAWRPVVAERFSKDTYRIIELTPDPDIERWEFASGELVRCRHQRLSGGECLVAYELASS
jgi:hypothetical protein